MATTATSAERLMALETNMSHQQKVADQILVKVDGIEASLGGINKQLNEMRGELKQAIAGMDTEFRKRGLDPETAEQDKRSMTLLRFIVNWKFLALAFGLVGFVINHFLGIYLG